MGIGTPNQQILPLRGRMTTKKEDKLYTNRNGKVLDQWGFCAKEELLA